MIGGFQSQVRGDQRGFQLFKRFGIEPGRARNDAFEFVCEPAVGFLQAGLEFVEKAHD